MGYEYDAASKADTSDRSQAINNTSASDLSSSIWQSMRDGESRPNLSDTKPTQLTLADTTNQTNASDSFSLNTGTRNSADVLPAVDFFDSAAPQTRSAGNGNTDANAPTATNSNELKFESYNASYVGEKSY